MSATPNPSDMRLTTFGALERLALFAEAAEADMRSLLRDPLSDEAASFLDNELALALVSLQVLAARARRTMDESPFGALADAPF